MFRFMIIVALKCLHKTLHTLGYDCVKHRLHTAMLTQLCLYNAYITSFVKNDVFTRLCKKKRIEVAKAITIGLLRFAENIAGEQIEGAIYHQKLFDFVANFHRCATFISD